MPSRKGSKNAGQDLYQQVEALAALQCTDEEIGSVLGISAKAVKKRCERDPEFKAAKERGQEKGKMSIRRQQMALAQAGNVTMLVWLGKNILGQADKIERKHEEAVDMSAIKNKFREELEKIKEKELDSVRTKAVEAEAKKIERIN